MSKYSSNFPKIRVIGLTGGIASGKSTVAKLFSAKGAQVIDADEISRNIAYPSSQDEIQSQFGTSDRKKLREIIFKDPSKRKNLEEILHPKIRSESSKRIREIGKNATDNTIVVYEATLLFESGRMGEFDYLVLVEAKERNRKERAIERGIPEEMIEDIFISQKSDIEKEKLSDLVIHNDDSIEHLEKHVDQVIASVFAQF